MVGANGWQDVQRVAVGMVQQRRAGHRQVGHSPGADQIAEVDQPLQLPLALCITQPDHVVLGDVQMHRLYRQRCYQWQQTTMSLFTSLDDTGASVGVLDHRQQVLDQRMSVARIPLQNALQARMIEACQCQVYTGTQFAQPDHHLMAQMPGVPQ